jgi:energy-coupling factor transport system ATP-binding protein
MGAESTPEAVRLEHVSFTYADQEVPALRDISMSVAAGEMVVVMGATGSGKSTLAKCINRSVPAFQPGTLLGQISILGRPLTNESVGDLAGLVGLVSQDFEAQLFATNVLQEVVFGMEQLRVPAAEMRTRLDDALRIVGLSGFQERDPATLSGGEKQRLAIAAILALQPRILIFDEPTTDLDPLGKQEIFSVLRTMREQGYTLVVIEHETLAAEYSDRLLILDGGRIVASGPPRELLAHVDLLETHGIRPPDLSRVAARLQLDAVPDGLDAAEAGLRAVGAGLPPVSAGASSARPPTAPPSMSAASTPLVRAEALAFAYDGQPVLADLSLELFAGEFVALIGQNGSGKTTLAKQLNGLLRPDHGRVLLEGTDLRDLPLDDVAAHVGYVFQNPDHQLFESSVRAEVAFAPRNLGCSPAEVSERVAEAVDAVALQGVEDVDPFLLGKGHRQRLAVASLLALRPRLLILDEPTTGLDYREQRQMMDLLDALHRRGLTVVIITHSPWVVAEYAQRALLMERGSIVFDGPLRQLFAQTELLHRAHFRTPTATQLGRRLGLSALSVDELIEQLPGAQGTAAAGEKEPGA